MKNNSYNTEEYLQNIKRSITPTNEQILSIIETNLLNRANSMISHDSYSDVNISEVSKGIHDMVMSIIKNIKIEKNE